MGEQADRLEVGQYLSAIGRRYPISPELRQQMVERCRELMVESKNRRVILGSIKVLAAMDAQNQRDEKAQREEERPQQAPTPQVHVHVELSQEAFSGFLTDVLPAVDVNPPLPAVQPEQGEDGQQSH